MAWNMRDLQGIHLRGSHPSGSHPTKPLQTTESWEILSSHDQADIPTKVMFNPFELASQGQSDVPEGKETAIKEYCQSKIDAGHEKCVWVCMKRGNGDKGVIARDVPLSGSDKPLEGDALWRQLGWWRVCSLHTIVEVKEVWIHFIGINKKRKEVEVITTEFDHQATTTRLDKEIKKALTGIEPSECKLNAFGESDCDQFPCANRALDENETWYYRVQRARDLEQQKEENALLSPMLQNCWVKNDIDTRAVERLEKSGFVIRYKLLQADNYRDAIKLYGKKVNAIMVIQGWKIDLITHLTVKILSRSSFWAAVVLVLTQSLDMALRTLIKCFAIGLVVLIAYIIPSVIY